MTTLKQLDHLVFKRKTIYARFWSQPDGLYIVITDIHFFEGGVGNINAFGVGATIAFIIKDTDDFHHHAVNTYALAYGINASTKQAFTHYSAKHANFSHLFLIQ